LIFRRREWLHIGAGGAGRALIANTSFLHISMIRGPISLAVTILVLWILLPKVLNAIERFLVVSLTSAANILEGFRLTAPPF